MYIYIYCIYIYMYVIIFYRVVIDLTMRKDSSGIAFSSEIFHVAVPGLRNEREHLIGITQAAPDRAFENERSEPEATL